MSQKYNALHSKNVYFFRVRGVFAYSFSIGTTIWKVKTFLKIFLLEFLL